MTDHVLNKRYQARGYRCAKCSMTFSSRKQSRLHPCKQFEDMPVTFKDDFNVRCSEIRDRWSVPERRSRRTIR